MKKLILLTLILSFVTGTFATSMSRTDIVSYASSLKGLKKAELKTAIYKLCQADQVLEYGSGSGHTWAGFYETDRIASTNECRNRYSTEKFYFSNSTSAISGMNIEHSFPKSWWGGSSNKAYKDLFNLYPSESGANSSKSNYPMGKVTNATILDDYEKVGKGEAGEFGTITLCEPNDLWKGDFSRSYFYMATIYQDFTWEGTQGLQELENDEWPTLREWAYTLYLEWVRNDRVSDIDVERNNAVYEIQGNRNLYIDFPELAEYVWGDSVDVAFNPTTSLTSASDDSRFIIYQAGNYEQGQSGGDVTKTAAVPELTASAIFTTDSYDVTITNAEAGATVYYTTDGSTPTTSSSSFTGDSKTLTITETTTVKAMAVVEGKDNSNVVSATYTKTSSTSIANTPETAYDITTAKALIDAGNDLTTLVYVKGRISKVSSYNEKYHSITYWISDDGTTTSDQFEIYSGLGMNQANFSSVDDIETGAYVIVCGQLNKYKSTYELNYNNYLVYYSTEEPSAINAVTIGADAKDAWYNLSGQRVSTLVKGQIYIVNGRKIIAE